MEMEMEMEKEKKEKEKGMENKEEKEMEKKFSTLHKRLGSLESQLTRIFSKSPESETLPSCAMLSDEINQNFHFINSLLTAEMASNSTQNTGRDEVRHLAQFAHRVKFLQTVCRAWSTPGQTSSFVESSEAPRCSYTDPDEDHVDEGDNELDNYYGDHNEMGELSMLGFKINQNPLFVSHDSDQNGLAELEGDDEDLEEKESVRDDSETEERRIKVEECIRDGDQSEEVESEESRIKEDIVGDYYDQKEVKTTKAEEESDDGYDNGVETHYCYRVVFWGGLIGMGIISTMAGFSEFPDEHSPVMFLTPT